MAYSTYTCSTCNKRFRSFDLNPAYCSATCQQHARHRHSTTGTVPAPPLETVWQRIHPGEWVLLEISHEHTQQRFLEVGYLMVETASHVKIWLPETGDRHASVHAYRQDTILGCHFLPQSVLYQLLPILPDLNTLTGSVRPLVEKLLRKNIDVRACVANYLRQHDADLWAKQTDYTPDSAHTHQQLLARVDKLPARAAGR